MVNDTLSAAYEAIGEVGCDFHLFFSLSGVAHSIILAVDSVVENTVNLCREFMPSMPASTIAFVSLVNKFPLLSEMPR